MVFRSRLRRALTAAESSSSRFWSFTIIRHLARRRITTTPPSKTTISLSATEVTAEKAKPASLNVSTISNGYKKFHDRRPHTTQFLQSLLVGMVGDSLSQLVISPEEDYSPLRTLKIMLTGSILSLPTYRWFLFMGRNINHANKYVSLAMKIVANQLCFAPFFLSSFLSLGFLWQGIFDPAQILANLKERIPTAWRNGCMFWPNIVVLNFTVVPPHFRGLVNSLASVVWQAYLSWLTFSSNRVVAASIEKEIEFEHKLEHAVVDTYQEAKAAVVKTEHKLEHAVVDTYKGAKAAVVNTEHKVLDYITNDKS